jgi:hypothetical protein
VQRTACCGRLDVCCADAGRLRRLLTWPRSGRQVSKQLLMEALDSDILAAVGCVPNEDVWRKKEIKENTRANLTQRKCGPAAPPPPPRPAAAARARAAVI